MNEIEAWVQRIRYLSNFFLEANISARRGTQLTNECEQVQSPAKVVATGSKLCITSDIYIQMKVEIVINSHKRRWALIQIWYIWLVGTAENGRVG